MQSTLFEKDSLRFVPCRSQRGCDTRSAQRVNSDAPVVGIYDQTDFASADAKLCEAFVLCTLNKHQPQQDQQCEARHAEDGDDESVEKIQPQRKLGEHAERA